MNQQEPSLTSQLLAFVRRYHDAWKEFDDVNEETTKMVADAKALLDRADASAPFRYTLKLRPPSFNTLPPRLPWKLIEIPKSNSHHYRRPDLPVSSYQYGVVEFEHKPTSLEVAHYDLERVW